MEEHVHHHDHDHHHDHGEDCCCEVFSGISISFHEGALIAPDEVENA